MNSKTGNIIAWVLQIALALFFAMPGWMKLATPVSKMVEMHMLQPGQSPTIFRVLGALELAGVLGIILPWALKIAPRLTPIAALGFCAVMIGALFVHSSKQDYKTLPMLAAALLAAAFVAWFRFRQLRARTALA